MCKSRNLLAFGLAAAMVLFGMTRFPWADDAKQVAAPRLSPADDEYYELFEVFVDALDQIERNYVQKVSREELLDAAIEGMLSHLDVHSDYIPPDQISEFRTSVENRFAGIGVQISPDLSISTPLYGTPGYRAGLKAGDKIVKIGGDSTEGMDVGDAVSHLKGEPGSTVTITVRSAADGKERDVTITRELIELETVQGVRRGPDDRWDYFYDHDAGIGYVRIVSFGERTPNDLKSVLQDLRKQGLKGLVLDLRFNPGGFLSAAIEVCDLFISNGVIVSTSGRNVEGNEWKASKRGTLEGFPIAVLVNRSSASASEIVAACVQDHHRGIVVGERTWGKGSVQNVVELPGGRSALKLTTSSYRRPNGKNIDRGPDAKEEDDWGVRPDDGYVVRLRQNEMFGVFSAMQRRGVIGKPAETAGRESDTANQESFTDRQIDKALEYLRGKSSGA